MASNTTSRSTRAIMSAVSMSGWNRRSCRFSPNISPFRWSGLLMEPMNKYLHRHAGENNPQEVGNVARGQGVRSDQHPVDNMFLLDSGLRQNDNTAIF